MKVSRKEQTESWFRWQAHIKNLSENGKVIFQELSYLKILFHERNIIGYEEEQIRPDEMGKLDVFQALEPCHELSRETRLILAGLSESELEDLKKK